MAHDAKAGKPAPRAEALSTAETSARSSDSSTPAVVVGALARVDVSQRESVIAALARLPGVSTFAIADDMQLGVLFEDDSLEGAHARLQQDVNPTPGVLAVWPVAVELDDPDPVKPEAP